MKIDSNSNSNKTQNFQLSQMKSRKIEHMKNYTIN